MEVFGPASLAFVITILLSVLLRPIALRLELTDKPGGRKSHIGEVPLVGGIAMFIGMIIGGAFAADGPGGLWSLLIPATLLVVVGVIDDRFGLSVNIRLISQLGAVLIMMLGGGLYLRDIGNPFGTGLFGLGYCAIPLSVLVALSVINAFNFIDGIDGLAASMALIVLGSGALVAGFSTQAIVVEAVCFAAVLGFFVINVIHSRRGPALTFMGDAGSTLLGFLVVWFTLAISQGADRALSPVFALWFALMPMADFFSCFFQRIRRGKIPLTPGREHFHHILLRAGMTPRQILFVLAGMGLVYAGVGLTATSFDWPEHWLFAIWLVLLVTQHAIVRRIAVYFRLRRLRARKLAPTRLVLR